MSYNELTHCDTCEFREECELVDGVNFCEECRYSGKCTIKDGLCKAGHAVECNNGFEPYGYMYDDLYDEESEEEE